MNAKQARENTNKYISKIDISNHIKHIDKMISEISVGGGSYYNLNPYNNSNELFFIGNDVSNLILDHYKELGFSSDLKTYNSNNLLYIKISW